jgi:hypothetical protein
MTQAILNQILDQLEALELEELQQLNQVIQNHFAAIEEAVQQGASQFCKKTRERGIYSRVLLANTGETMRMLP